MSHLDRLPLCMGAYLENVALFELRVAGLLPEFGLQITSLVRHQIYPALKAKGRQQIIHQEKSYTVSTTCRTISLEALEVTLTHTQTC